MARPTALVVEDTPEFALLSTKLLETEGFRVVTTPDGERAVDLARRETPELVLLDITLPGLDGIEVCRRIREFSDCYVVMVTARHEEIDRVLGLSMGADDYVTKPYSSRELAARIKAMRRRPRTPANPELRRFGELVVDPVAREVSLGGEPLDLTKIEYDLLDLLSGSPRRTFERAQLMSEVWGGEWHGDDHVIDVHLGNLRRKLGESASRQRHIRTVRGVGYRFEPSPAAATAQG
ncbi:response regulator transcription factor [Terrabacter sp. NPDC000476]|uniref:response regulator transcription factor n=1 Tax=Terrabacter sp. NPDC000476 TaxID=3154258 RepID=UPI003323EE1F